MAVTIVVLRGGKRLKFDGQNGELVHLVAGDQVALEGAELPTARFEVKGPDLMVEVEGELPVKLIGFLDETGAPMVEVVAEDAILGKLLSAIETAAGEPLDDENHVDYVGVYEYGPGDNLSFRDSGDYGPNRIGTDGKLESEITSVGQTRSVAVVAITPTEEAPAAPLPPAEVEASNDVAFATEDGALNPANVDGADNGASVATGNMLTNDLSRNGENLTLLTMTVNGVPTAVVGGAAGTEIQGLYGKLFVWPDGSYRYELDNANADVNARGLHSDPLLDAFTYTMTDESGNVATATLRVNIGGANDEAILGDDGARLADLIEVTESATVPAPPAGGGINNNPGVNNKVDFTRSVLDNDTDDIGDTLSVHDVKAQGAAGAADTVDQFSGGTGSATVQGTWGRLTLNEDGTFSYDLDDSAAVDALDDGDTQTDTFDYTVIDDSHQVSDPGQPGHITVTIRGKNDAVRTADDTNAVTQDLDPATDAVVATTTRTEGVLGNDFDAEGKAFTVTGIQFQNPTTGLSTLQAVAANGAATTGSTIIQGLHGELTINWDGTYSYRLTDRTLGHDVQRTETFTYTVTDTSNGTALTSTGALTIDVTGANDRPVTANDAAEVTEAGGDGTGPSGLSAGTPSASGNVILGAGGVGKDTDIDTGETAGLTVTSVNGAAAGVNTVIEGKYGNIIIHADGSYTYALANSTPITINGQPFTFTTTQIAALNQLAAGDVVTDETFTYQVSDTSGQANAQSTNGTITITVNGANDAPIASDNTDGTALREAGVVPVNGLPIDPGTDNAGNNSATGNVVTNGTADRDPDTGDTFTVTGARAGDEASAGTATAVAGATEVDGKYGILLINTDGSYTYVLANNLDVNRQITVNGHQFTFSQTQINNLNELNGAEDATEQFTYTITDNHAATDRATLTFNITGANDRPVIQGLDGDGGELFRDIGTITNWTNLDTNGDAVVADPDVDATDNTNQSITRAIVRFTDNPLLPADPSTFRTGDVLRIDTVGLTGNALTLANAANLAYDPVNGILTITGPGSLADYQALLRHVQFGTLNQTLVTRVLEIGVFDGAVWSTPVTVSLGVSLFTPNSDPTDLTDGPYVDIGAIDPANYRPGSQYRGLMGNDKVRLAGLTVADSAITAAASGFLINGVTQAFWGDTVRADTAFSANGDTAGGDDEVIGRNADDLIFGQGGADTLFGDGGDDTINGGQGNDLLDGGAGQDSILGGGGDDTLTFASATAGGIVTDLSTGGTGGIAAGDRYDSSIEVAWASDFGDTITGYAGQATTIRGGAGNDSLTGGSAADSILGNGGDDILTGNGGNDTLRGGIGADMLLGGGQNDSLDGGAGADTIDGGTENDVLLGGTENDSLIGGAGSDTLDGGADNDLLEGGLGADSIVGGGGADTVSFANSAGVHVDLGALNGAQTLAGAAGNEATNDTIVGVNNAIGSGFGDTIIGHNANNSIIDGGAGGDSLFGGVGTTADTLLGGEGSDTLNGGLRNDSLLGGEGDDVLIGGHDGTSTNDTLRGEGGTDTATYNTTDYAAGNVRIQVDVGEANSTVTKFAGATNLGIDSLFGIENIIGTGNNDTFNGASLSSATTLNGAGGNADIISYLNTVGTVGAIFALNSPGFVNSGVATNNILSNFEIGVGTRNADTILASTTYGTTLDGSDGDDVLDGLVDAIAGHQDSLIGGAGDDSIIVGTSAGDTVDGGAGTNDIISFEHFTAGITFTLQNVSSNQTGANNVRLIGDVSSNSTIEHIRGGDGADVLVGNGFANSIFGGLGGDTLDGAAGNDSLLGEAGNDSLTGSWGSDRVDGGADDDRLSGGADRDATTVSSDTLIGGAGTDTVTYAGADYTAQGTRVLVNVGANTVTKFAGAAGTPNVGVDHLNGIEYIEGTGNTLIGDTFLGAATTAATTLDGAGGNLDIISYANAAAGVGAVFALNVAAGYTNAGAAANNVLVNFEIGMGTNAADSIGGSTTYATTIDGGAGADTITGFGSAESLVGGQDDDVINAGGGQDTLDGGIGNDLLNGGANGDSIVGGGGIGSDTLSYQGSASVHVDLTRAVQVQGGGAANNDAIGDSISGIDNVLGSGSADTIVGNANANILDGSGGNDSLSGTTGADSLFGGAGNDTLVGTLSITDVGKRLDGGVHDTNGGDTADYSAISAVANLQVTVDLNAGSVTLTGATNADTLTDTLVGIESFTGNSNNVAGRITNYIYASDGANTLRGGDGIDVADYSRAATQTAIVLSLATGGTLGAAAGDNLTNIEYIIGTSGHDTITAAGVNFGVTLSGGANGADSLVGGNAGDWFVTGLGADTMVGGTGADTVDYSSATESITAVIGDTTSAAVISADVLASGDSLNGIDVLISGSGADSLTGDGGNNTIYGGGGSDTLEGGAGADLLNGQAAVNPDATDVNNWANYSRSPVAVYVDLNIAGAQGRGPTGTEAPAGGHQINDTLVGIQHLIGSSGRDTLLGSSENNYLIGDVAGGPGASDVLNGRGGNDTLDPGIATSRIGTGGDLVDGGTGFDWLVLANTGISGGIYFRNVPNTWQNADQTIPGNPFPASATGINVVASTHVGNLSSIEGIIGTDGGDDTILGVGQTGLGGVSGQVAFDEAAIGAAGNDQIDLGAGDDSVNGGAGSDRLWGSTDTGIIGDWVDYSYAQAGIGLVIDLGSATGVVTLQGATGDADTISGFENVIGTQSADSIVGNGSVNMLEGGVGSDTLVGVNNGAGFGIPGVTASGDYVSYSTAKSGVTVDLSRQWTGQTQSGSAGNAAAGDVFVNISGVVGSAFADNLTGDSLNNTLVGGGGADTFSGGLGVDRVSYHTYIGVDAGAIYAATDTLNSGLVIDVANPSASTGDAQGDIISNNIEQIEGTRYADIIRGGNDTARFLFGGRQPGLPGTTAANDARDTLISGSQSDTLEGGAGGDSLSGGASTGATASYVTATTAIQLVLDAATLPGGAAAAIDALSGGDARGDILHNITQIYGSSLGDVIRVNNSQGWVIVGAGGLDVLTGGSQRDTINALDPGGANADVVAGGGGGDLLIIDTSDILDYRGSAGAIDVMFSRAVQIGGDANGDTITADVNNVTRGSAAFIYGSNNLTQGDIINVAGFGIDTGVEGGAGADTLTGDAGDRVSYTADTVGVVVDLDLTDGLGPNFVGNKVSTTNSHAQGDIITGFNNATGGSGDDYLQGNAATNNLTGNDANDTLDGAGGNDILNGGRGADLLIGGGNFNDQIQYRLAATATTTNAGVNHAGDSNGRITLLEGAGYTRNFFGVRVDLSDATGLSNIGEARDTQTGAGDTLQSFTTIDATGWDDHLIDANSPVSHRFLGQNGNDTLNGGTGGFDSLVGGNNDDLLIANGNVVNGSGPHAIFDGGLGVDTLRIRAGVASMDFASLSDNVTTADSFQDQGSYRLVSIERIDLTQANGVTLTLDSDNVFYDNSTSAIESGLLEASVNDRILIRGDGDDRVNLFNSGNGGSTSNWSRIVGQTVSIDTGDGTGAHNYELYRTSAAGSHHDLLIQQGVIVNGVAVP